MSMIPYVQLIKEIVMKYTVQQIMFLESEFGLTIETIENFRKSAEALIISEGLCCMMSCEECCCHSNLDPTECALGNTEWMKYSMETEFDRDWCLKVSKAYMDRFNELLRKYYEKYTDMAECNECGWTGRQSEILEQSNPFVHGALIYACPQCKTIRNSQ